MRRKEINIKKIIKKKVEYREKTTSLNRIQRNKPQETKPIINQIKSDKNIAGETINQPILNSTDVKNNRTKRRLNNQTEPINVDLMKSNKTLNSEVKPILDVNVDNEFRSKFKILFLIFNYERINMLNKIINEINSFNKDGHIIDYVIFDDRSSYKIDDDRFIVNPKHRGKELLWETFDDMFKYVKNNKKYDLYVVSPNDFVNYDFNRLIKYGYHFRNDNFLFNLINDGREKTWGVKNQEPYNDEIFRFYFNDCSFITNWKTLNLLEFKMEKINKKRFHKENISSGVGNQITFRCLKLGINIYKPVKSLIYHGDHESLMHGEYRKKNKLLSI